MLNKIKNIFFILSFFIFIFIITRYYFSEKNIIITNKLRSLYTLSGNKNLKSLPILENDTNDIIIYKNDLEEFKKKSKKRIWEKLISNDNE
tara:strand:+ start:138 stop:410 length:273 start_codon:yes stop_codon:yes gene_type:complete